MKKNKLKFAFLFGMIMLDGLSLSSCSGDDDDDGGSGSKSVGVLDENTGLRITSAGGYNYVYQDDGRLLYILSGSSCRYEFSYNPNKIAHVDDGDYEEAENYTISYNGSGYVSSASSSEKWDEGDEYVETTSDASFSYDGNGHLTRISGKYKETEYENGKTYTESGTVTYTLTWSNSLLQKVVCSEEGRDENGRPFKYVETYTLSYNNDAMANNTNKYLQYACFVDPIFSDLMERICYVGLLGNGPAFLPSGLEYEEKEEYYNESGEKKNYEYSGSHTYRYGFNSDGAISYDYEGSYRNSTYSYDYVEVSSGGNTSFTRASERQITSLQKHKRHLDLFKMHRNIKK